MVAPRRMSDQPNNAHETREARVGELGRTYAAALLSGDEVAAEIVIREAMEAGFTTPEIDDEIIAPALWLVGELWERGDISIADEHVATEISLRVLALQHQVEHDEVGAEAAAELDAFVAVAGRLDVESL